ncbi:MAG: TolC family protein [Bacteroidia bacterium]
MKKNIFLLVLLIISKSGFCQSDSVFTLDNLYKLVMLNHPVAQQAELLPEAARFEIRAARGAFDPKVQIQFDEKEFDTKRYWNNLNTMLKVPAWIGEFKGGFERNRGNFISASDNTPLSGLLSAGYSLPLGAGLLIDERRSTLRQAQLLKEISIAERLKVINKLLLEVAVDYWDWYTAYRQLNFIEDAYTLASIRFDAVKEMTELGSQSGLDTVEAFSNLALRDIQRIQAQLNLQNTALVLSNHIWDPNGLPMQLDSLAIPQEISRISRTINKNLLDSLKSQAITNHPDLIKLDAKISQLGIEKRFRQEMLKPTIDLEYNFLQSGLGDVQTNNGLFLSNYKFGLSVGMPLLLRKERGKLQGTKVKLNLAELELINRRRTVETEVLTRYNDVKNLEELLLKQDIILNAYRTLVFGEQEKFRNGESSLFIINARESKLVESGMKLADFEAKFAKSIAYLYWSSGLSEANN